MNETWNPSDPAMLLVDGGPNDGRTIIVAKPTITLGRLAENDLVVNEPAVSRKHAEISRTDDGYYLRDLNTTNGTFVNRTNIGKEPYLLKDGDRISLARTEISFVFAMDSSKTIQLPQSQLPAELPGIAASLPGQSGSSSERAQALQANLQQLEVAYQQATNYAQQLSEEVAEDRQQQERSMQRRAAQVAREEERKRLAEELHDETMGDLAAMALEVGLLRRQAGQITDASGGNLKEVEDSLLALGTKLKDTNVRLRQMVQGISPSVLTDLGLVEALKSFLDDLSKRPISNPYPLKVDFNVAGFDEQRLAEEVEVGLYRVAQQGVNNAIQHAQARNLAVDLSWQEDAVTLSIADDGVGFDVENPKESPLTGHFGMANLKDRIEGIKGTLQITSKEGEGTTIFATVPTSSTAASSTEVATTTYRLRPPPPGRPSRRS